MEKEISAVEEKHLLLARNITGALSRYTLDLEAGFRHTLGEIANGQPQLETSRFLDALGFKYICVIDGDGRVKRIATDSSGVKISRLAPPVLQSLQTVLAVAKANPEKIYFSGVTGDSAGSPTVYLVRALPEGLFGIGAVGTKYIVELQQSIAFGARGHAAIVDRRGKVLAHPNPEWRASMKDLSAVKPVKKMMAGETGVTEFFSPATQANMIVGYNVVPRVGWGVMIPQPFEELEERAGDVRMVALWIALLGIFVAGLISWWLARFLARPIQEVADSAREIATGQLSSRVPGTRRFVPAELRDLSSSFNMMVEEVSAKNAKLEEVAARLANAQRIAKIGNWQWKITTDELTWSDEIFEMFGLTPGQMRPATAAFQAAIHPDDFDLVNGAFARTIWEGQPLDLVHRMVTPNGTELVVHQQAEVHYDGSGKPIRLTGTTQDITERKREEALRESEERFRNLVGQAADAFFLHNSDGKIVDVNERACDSLGYPREKLLDLSLPEIDRNFDANQFSKLMARVAPGTPLTYNGSHRRSDNSTFPVEVRTGLIDSGGRQLMLSVARDISERKLLEEQLLQSQKMEAIGTLAGGIAHDFNNILAPILGFSQLALDKMPPGSEAQSDLTMVRDAALRAKEIVSQILLFGRKAEGGQSVFNLGAQLRESVGFLRSTLPKTIAIEENITAESAVVVGNANQIHQVLINLCVNSARAMPEGGKLTISVEQVELEVFECYLGERISGPYLRIAVEDTGVGIAASDLPHIFEPFFTTKPVGQGTGLGLSTVLGIVRQHGGEVNVTSAPGEGSTFEVFLPPAGALPDTPSPEQVPDSRGTESILVVDDEKPVAVFTEKALQRLGYRVTALTSSAEALSVFRGDPSRFDLIIMDQMMPEMTGENLTRKIKEIRDDIPIILCTGFSDSVTPEKISDLGLSGFFYKPISPAELGDVVRRTLEGVRHAEPPPEASA